MQPTLRGATAAAHHALDHHPLLQQLTRSGLTRENYARSLAALHRPHARLEHRVHQSRHYLASGLSLSTRLPQLEADLRALGCAVSRVTHEPPDPMETRAAWWGRVYVLEGSRLGGAFIARRVHASLGDSVPCAYFRGAMAPDDTPSLHALLGQALEGKHEIAQAIAGARSAFAAYGADLDELDGRSKPQTCHGQK